jgi:hypothetical protein
LPKPLSKRPLAFFLIAVGLLALIFFARPYLEGYYRSQLWDPDTAALVNGAPILRKDVEEALREGFNPSLSMEEKAKGAVTIGQILDRLIEAELVRQAAQASGLSVSQEELQAALRDIWGSWGCQAEDPQGRPCQVPKGQELMSFLAALKDQLLLKAVAREVASKRSQRSRDDWQAFWNRWSAKHSRSSLYQVRSLLAEPNPAAEKILSSRRGLTLEEDFLTEMAIKVREAGYSVIISQPMSLYPLDPEVERLFPGLNLASELSEASLSPQKLTKVLRLPESYAVFEVISVSPPVSSEELAKAGRNAYEDLVSDRAFRLWLEEEKAKADIVVNPNFSP